MAKTTSPTRYRVDANVAFNPENSEGTKDGYRRIYNITSFAVQYATETDSIIGRDLDNSQQTLDSLVSAGETTVSMTANRVNGYGLSLINRGTESVATSGSINVTDEVYSFEGDSFQIIKRDVTAGTVAIRGLDLTVDDTTGFTAGNVLTNDTTGKTIGVIESVPDGTSLHVFLTDTTPAVGDDVTDDGGTTTATIASSGVAAKNDLAVITTDFTETEDSDTEVMTVARVSSGALDVANLTKVMINYTYTQDTGSQVAMGKETQIKGEMHITGTNRVTKKPFDVFLREVTLSADGDVPLISDDTAEFSFTGTAATPAGQTDFGYIRTGE